jgi:hypothetical protein
MRFSHQFCRSFLAAVFLLCAPTAWASTFTLPDAAYSVDASTATCDGINCSKAYVKQLTATTPATLQVGCTADVGAPICAGSLLAAAPAPFLSVEATTALNHQSQNSIGVATVTYYFEVLCDTCAPGTLVPVLVGGSMEAHYIQGSGGTVVFNALARAFVNSFDPLLMTEGALVDMSMQGSGAFAGDLTKIPNTLVGVAPNGFGFCESTWTGFFNCTGGPSSPYGAVIEVRVNDPNSIFLDARASVAATNQPFSTSLAEVTIDPVISFGPGFDSTGFSIVESSGIGNVASTVPEPATWTLLSIVALGWGCSRMRRRIARE